MSVVRGFGLNGKSYYTNVAKPQDIALQFTVTATNGLGVTSVKSNGYVRNVFMHTSTTPAANNGYTNPNPANGIVMIQMRNNFNAFLGAIASVTSTSQTDTKIDNSALVAGNVYVITTLGNATAAKWLAIGVPVGVTPAVGVAFVALNNGGAGNTLTSRVQVPNQSNISNIEFFGNPIATSNSNVNSNSGQYLLAQCMSPVIAVATGTSGDAVTNNAGVLNSSGGQDVAATLTLAAPTAGSLINMSLFFDASSVTVDGL